MRPSVALLLAALMTAPAVAGPRVDLNPDNGRGDIRTAEWHNWPVRDGGPANVSVAGVAFTLRPAGGAKGLATAWWKPGVAHGATVASDGVTAPGGALELVLRGLTPGRHGVVTYHNAVGDAAAGPVEVAVDGVVVLKDFRPSHRVRDDADAAAAYFEITATADKDVVVRFEGDGLILNGFAIGVHDPARQVSRPLPAHADEHAAEEPVLTWVPAKSATTYHVYLGTDADAVAKATPKSPEYRGTRTDARYPTAGLSPLATYYWRVDTLHADATTPGEVWRFRVRRLAFPGAEGYGRFAIGGRGGRVIEVTTLDDAGPGSLRAAVEAEGPRTVVFRVGGLIALKSKLIIKHPYLTIAGQTAPGDGICLKGWSVGGIGTHDLILRHLRIRVGDEAGTTLDGAGLRSCDHCIIDHCSISWSIDEAFSSREAKNITVQRCLIGEALNFANHEKYVGTNKGHSFAASISGDRGSFHHNLLANCAGRNWSLAGGLDAEGRFAGALDIRNNVVYNWAHRTTDGGAREVNFVGNYYLPGPATKVFHLLKPDVGTDGNRQRYHVAGNVMDGKPEVERDNWAGVALAADLVGAAKSATPFFAPHLATHTARQAYDSVLADVGATLPRQDVVDQRLLREVRERKHTYTGSKSKLPGIIDRQADVGGWPEYKGGAPPADGDHDGLPDAWEAAHGLDPRDPADANRDAGDGYTLLEKYLNGIGPSR